MPDISGWSEQELEDRSEGLAYLIRKAWRKIATHISTAFKIQSGVTVAQQIGPEWDNLVEKQMMGYIETIYLDAAGAITDALEAPEEVLLGDEFVQAYIDTARNRLKSLGDEVWAVVQQQITLGMAAGESVALIAARIKNTTGVSDGRAMTIARTEVHQAYEAATYEQAKFVDPLAYKVWMATEDSHTRPTHAAADGQRVKINESFQVGDSNLRYPGDPLGDPGETINCRCTATYSFDMITPSDDVISDKELVMTAASTWKPQAHPRGSDGKFISKGAVADFFGKSKLNIMDVSKAVKELTPQQWNALTPEQKSHLSASVAKLPSGSYLKQKTSDQLAEKANAAAKIKQVPKVTAPAVSEKLPFYELDDLNIKGAKPYVTLAHDLKTGQTLVKNSPADASVTLFSKNGNFLGNAQTPSGVLALIKKLGGKPENWKLGPKAPNAPSVEAPAKPISKSGVPQKVTTTLIWGKHPAGTTILQSGDGSNEQVVWNGKKYDYVVDGKVVKSLTKKDTYAELKGDTHWVKPSVKTQTETMPLDSKADWQNLWIKGLVTTSEYEAKWGVGPTGVPVETPKIKSLVPDNFDGQPGGVNIGLKIGKVIIHDNREHYEDGKIIAVSSDGKKVLQYNSKQSAPGSGVHSTWRYDEVNTETGEVTPHAPIAAIVQLRAQNADGKTAKWNISSDVLKLAGVGAPPAVENESTITNWPGVWSGTYQPGQIIAQSPDGFSKVVQSGVGPYALIKDDDGTVIGPFLKTNFQGIANIDHENVAWEVPPKDKSSFETSIFNTPTPPSPIVEDAPATPSFGTSIFGATPSDPDWDSLATNFFNDEEIIAVSEDGKYKVQYLDDDAEKKILLIKDGQPFQAINLTESFFPQDEWPTYVPDKLSEWTGGTTWAAPGYESTPSAPVTTPAPTLATGEVLDFTTLAELGNQYIGKQMPNVDIAKSTDGKYVMTYENGSFFVKDVDEGDYSVTDTLYAENAATKFAVKHPGTQWVALPINTGGVTQPAGTDGVSEPTGLSNTGDSDLDFMLQEAHDHALTKSEAGYLISAIDQKQFNQLSSKQKDGIEQALFINKSHTTLSPEVDKKWLALKKNFETAGSPTEVTIPPTVTKPPSGDISLPPAAKAPTSVDTLPPYVIKQFKNAFDAGEKKTSWYSKSEAIWDKIKEIQQQYPDPDKPGHSIYNPLQILQAMDTTTKTSKTTAPYTDKMVKWAKTSKGLSYTKETGVTHINDPSVASNPAAIWAKALDPGTPPNTVLAIGQLKNGDTYQLMSADEPGQKPKVVAPSGYASQVWSKSGLNSYFGSPAYTWTTSGGDLIEPPQGWKPSTISAPTKPTAPGAPKISIPAKIPGAITSVDLGAGDITHLNEDFKKGMYQEFKALGSAAYLDTAPKTLYFTLKQISDNHGMSMLQALRVIDDTGAKKFGVDNKFLFEKKIKDWLSTPKGAAAALGLGIPLPPTPEFHAGMGHENIPSFEESSKFDYPVISYAKASALQKASVAASGQPLSSTELAAVKTYTGSSAFTINSYLYGEQDDLSSSFMGVAKRSQKAMRPLTESIMLHRGVGYGGIGAHNHEGILKMVGQTWKNGGFSSASIGGKAAFSGNPVILEIEVPKGTPAMYAQEVSSHPGEDEFLLAAGTNYHIMSVKKKGSQSIVRVRVVPPPVIDTPPPKVDTEEQALKAAAV